MIVLVTQGVARIVCDTQIGPRTLQLERAGEWADAARLDGLSNQEARDSEYAWTRYRDEWRRRTP